MHQIRQKAIQGLETGDTFTVTRTFTREEVFRFAEISRDYNPIHFDERFTRVKNMNGLICHGLLVAGMVTEIGGQIGWLASGMEFRFMKPVYLGDTVTCTFVIDRIDGRRNSRGTAVFRNQHGEEVLKAVITGIVPGPGERDVMQQMVEEGDPTNKITHHGASDRFRSSDI